MSLKKELLKAFGAVKRTLKEFKSYVLETEQEKQKLQKMEEEKQEESDIKKQKYSVEETEGAKNQSYKTLIKFIEPLKEVIAKICGISKEEVTDEYIEIALEKTPVEEMNPDGTKSNELRNYYDDELKEKLKPLIERDRKNERFC